MYLNQNAQLDILNRLFQATSTASTGDLWDFGYRASGLAYRAENWGTTKQKSEVIDFLVDCAVQLAREFSRDRFSLTAWGYLNTIRTVFAPDVWSTKWSPLDFETAAAALDALSDKISDGSEK